VVTNNGANPIKFELTTTNTKEFTINNTGTLQPKMARTITI